MKNDDFWGEPMGVYLSEDAEIDGIHVRAFNKNINCLTISVNNRRMSSLKKEAIKIQKARGLDMEKFLSKTVFGG